MYFAAYDARLGIDSAELCLSDINSRPKVALGDRQSVSAFRVSEVYLVSSTHLCTVVVLQGPGRISPEHLVHVLPFRPLVTIRKRDRRAQAVGYPVDSSYLHAAP